MTGRILFVLVLIADDHRRIVHVNCTDHRTSGWTAPQLVEGFPQDTTPIARTNQTATYSTQIDRPVRPRISSATGVIWRMWPSRLLVGGRNM